MVYVLFVGLYVNHITAISDCIAFEYGRGRDEEDMV
jgi:hypothetical protein